MSDVQKMKGSFDTPVSDDRNVLITGKGPVSEFMDYPIEFAAFTKGKGNIYMVFSEYRKCHNQEEVIKRKNYDKEADIENTSSSVFCAKGTSFLVKWDECEKYMHCI